MARIVVILFILLSGVLPSQNLVPNGSFETYTTCPNFASQIYYAAPWMGKDNNSVDYFNACAPLPYNVPYSGGIAFQYAADGVGYAAFWAYNGVNNNYREYAQVQLTNQLVVNQYYYLRFYINNAPTKYVVNNIGAAITNTAIGLTGGSGSVLNYTPAILKYGNPIINDTLNWIEISAVYKSLGGEEYLTIGNFFSDGNTDTLAANYGTYQGTYCYLDNVSLVNITTPQWQYRDTTVTLGDSVLIGPAITGLTIDWYNMNTSFIKNAPGIYVKPAATTKYKATETFNASVYDHTVTVTVLPPNAIDDYARLQNSVSIFPNPGTTNFSIASVGLIEGAIEITVTDVNGREVYRTNQQVTNALTQFSIDVKSGIYFVKITKALTGETVLKKLAVQH